MNAPEGWTTGASNGCTAAGCGTQDTVTLDGHHGRRCQAHPPTFDPQRAVHLAVTGRLHTALGYCRTELAA